MSYARDNDAAEQCAQAEGERKKPTDFDRMLERHGYEADDWNELSNSERDRMRWNWKHISAKEQE